MASREENLKKINVELEKLSDDELDRIAGGSTSQTSDDSKFLNVLLRGRPEQCERYGKFKAFWATEGVEKAWKSVGIKFDPYNGPWENYYYLDGKEISREQAWAHAEKVIGKHLERSDWDW